MTFLQVLKDALDTGGYCRLSLLGVLLLHANPKATAVADAFLCIRETSFLVIELAENEVEQLPKGCLLHALIAIDIVVATLESLHERLVGRFTGHGTLALCFKVSKSLTLAGEIGYGLASNLPEIILASMDILQVFAIRPTGKLAVGGTEDIVSSGFHASLLVVGLHLGILGNDDKTNQLISIMGMTGIEDGQVHLLRLGLAAFLVFILHLEVTLHVFRCKAILFGHHRNHGLQRHFLLRSLHHAIGERTNHLVLSKYYLILRCCCIIIFFCCHNWVQNYTFILRNRHFCVVHVDPCSVCTPLVTTECANFVLFPFYFR